MTSELWSVEGRDPSENAYVKLLLDKARHERGGITKSEWRAIADESKSEALVRHLERLVSNGFLIRTHDDRYLFAHRLIQDWWVGR